MNKHALGLLVLPILAFIAAFAVQPMLPEKIAIHWDISGTANGFASSSAIYLLPAIMLILAIVFWVLPKIEVFQKNLQQAIDAYWVVGIAVQAMLFLLFVVTTLSNLDYQIPITQTILILVGLLFIVLGRLLPRFKRNFLVGIRTPWTLANDTVWDKTHQFGAKMFPAAGVVLMLTAITSAELWPYLLGAAFGLLLCPIMYSYLEYRKNPKNQL